MALTDPGDGPLPAALDLRAVDADALAAARSLADAIDGTRMPGERTLAARVGFSVSSTGWLEAGDVRIAIRVAHGVPMSLHPERVEAMVAALDAVDPVLDAVEAAAGLLIEPTAAAAGPAGTPLVELWLGAADAPDALLLLIPRSDWHPPAGSRARSRAPTVPVTRTVRGPRLSIDDASGIEAGDMLMLPAGGWTMEATAASRIWTGTYDPGTGQLVVDPEGRAPPDKVPPDKAPPDEDSSMSASPTGSPPAFTVPISIRLPDTTASLDELSRLLPGATLALGPAAAGLDVDLRIADRVVASGELVRLGDAYAVLVTRVPGADAPSVTAARDPEDDSAAI